MKRIKYLLLTIIFCVPMLVNATNTTYNVCKNGCEYTELETVLAELEARGTHYDNDTVTINITDTGTYTINEHHLNVSSEYQDLASLTINGNNATIVLNSTLEMYAKEININDFIVKDYWVDEGAAGYYTGTLSPYANNVKLKNVKVGSVLLNNGNASPNLAVESSEIFNISLQGNIDVKDTKVSRIGVSSGTEYKLKNVTANRIDMNSAGSANDPDSNIDFDNLNVDGFFQLNSAKGNINNSKIGGLGATEVTLDLNNHTGKIINIASGKNSTINVYNPKNDKIDYHKINSENQTNELFTNISEAEDPNSWIYTYADINMKSNVNAQINIFFDGTKTIKVNDKLDFSTLFNTIKSGDKLTYKVDDTSVAKMDGNNIVGLKEGTTKITATSENGAVNYTLNLTVEKATIIDKMNVDVPITGKSIKLWMILLAGVLFGVIGVAVYMLIRRKK